MEKYLKPERLELDPSKPEAADTWRHWKMTFNIFLEAVYETQPPTSMKDRLKLKLLINLLSPAIFKHISDIHDYSTAMNILEEIFVKPINSVFCRHLLANHQQQTDESLDQYLQTLKRLAKDCDFQAVTATHYVHIRQRFLENKTVDLKTAYDQALTLEMAQRQLASYSQPNSLTASVSTVRTEETDDCISVCDEQPTVAAISGPKCFFCGNQRHDRPRCPARNSICKNCKKKGHFARVYRSHTGAATNYGKSLLASSTLNFSVSLSRSSMCGEIKGVPVKILVDTGNSENFIHPDKVKRLGLTVTPSSERILMASSSHSSTALVHNIVTLHLSGREYNNIKLSVMANICCDVILGHSFLCEHSSVEIPFGGPLPPLTVCRLTTIKNIPYPSLFTNLTPDCRPIAVKSRRHSIPDTKFIQSEISRMLKEGIIEPSQSQ